MIKLSEQIGSDETKCLLCPHFCELKKEEYGKCGVRKFNGNEIILDNYGMLTHIAVEPIEKKPFFNFLPKTKTLSISSNSCNMDCSFCENHKISQKKEIEKTQIYNPNDIIKIAEEKNCESVCMTYNEPIISIEYLMDLGRECKKNNLKFVLKTNAYINKEPWKEILKITDAINIDWKGSPENYNNLCGANDYVVLDRIKEAYISGTHIEISIPIHCDLVHSKEFYTLGHFLGKLGKYIPVHLLRVNPAYKHIDKEIVSIEELERIKRIFSGYHILAYIHIN